VLGQPIEKAISHRGVNAIENTVLVTKS